MTALDRQAERRLLKVLGQLQEIVDVFRRTSAGMNPSDVPGCLEDIVREALLEWK